LTALTAFCFDLRWRQDRSERLHPPLVLTVAPLLPQNLREIGKGRRHGGKDLRHEPSELLFLLDVQPHTPIFPSVADGFTFADPTILLTVLAMGTGSAL